MEAQKKTVTVWNAQDLEVDLSQVKQTDLLKLSIPVREVKCQIVQGESSQEAGENLALKLREAEIV